MIYGFIGPSGTGKNLTETAWTLDTAIQAQQANIDYRIFTNYAMFNGDGKTPLPGIHPIEDVTHIPELNNCQMNLTELTLTLGSDPRMNANRQNLFVTRACANLRKKHVNFLFDAKDPESEVDKRIRFSTDLWVAPIYAKQLDMIIQCFFTRTKKFLQAYDDDRVLEEAELITPITNASRFFPYYDTDQTFENFQQPYPLNQMTEAFQQWLNNEKAKPSNLTLSEFLVATNQEAPNSLQRTAILSRLQRLQNQPQKPQQA